MKVHILYGLPGSGKTTWAKSQYESRVIDCDRMRGGYSATKLSNAIRRLPRVAEPEHVIVDGLFTEFDQVEEAVNAINVKNDVSYVLHAWNRDLDGCFHNDSKRPLERRAVLSIRSLGSTYKIPGNKKLKTIGILESIRHKVETNSYIDWWEKFDLVNPYDVPKDNQPKYLCSSTWNVGGETWSYTGDRWAVDAESPPLSFSELDELLTSMVPQVTFLQYKKIENECITIESHTDRDYYHVYHMQYYRCDLHRLEELLKEFGHRGVY